MSEAIEHDLVEALSLLRERNMEQSRQRGRKDNAAKRLFEQLRALDGRYDLHVQAEHPDDWNELVVSLSPARLYVSYMRENGVRVARYGEESEGAEVPLDYDREQECFVSREPERFRTPIPGEPVPRRTAIAVLIEAIIAAANKGPTR